MSAQYPLPPIPMELLAPAGGMEQLRAAVRFGADAVYLAADRFGMRARAANFAMADIPAAVAFAHEHGVKVHVTCNILMHPDDIDGLPAFFRALDAAGVEQADGMLFDLGVSSPQHSSAELSQFRSENERGFEYEGRHYTGYEATQMQRRLERAIRKQKNQVIASRETDNTDWQRQSRSKLTILRQRYRDFSKAAGLIQQNERTFVSGFSGR